MHFRAASNELGSPKILACPKDSGKTPASDFNKFDNRNISYFISFYADEGQPETILSGDRNLSTTGVALGSGVFTLTSSDTVGWTPAIHNNAGNVGLSSSVTVGADGLGLISYLDRTNRDLKLAHLSNPFGVPFLRRR